MPANTETYMEECSKEASPIDFGVTVSALTARHQGNVNLIHEVSLTKDTVKLLDADTVGACTPLPL